MPPAPAIGPNTLTSFGARGYKSEIKSTYDRNPDRNNGHFHSVSELGVNPDGTMGTASKLEALKPYFGIAQRQSKEEPYSWWDTENHTLPDGLRGKCQYLLNIIITAILTTEMWPVTEALPYKKADSLTVQWDEWRFNDHLLDRTPEEAVSRMTTNSKNSFAVHIIRHGKAFMLEHGFWMTPMGQKNWAMNIIQIVNATTETGCLGAVVAYMTAAPYVDNNSQFSQHRQNSSRDIDSMMVDETDGFARVQKEENGYKIMISKMKEIFRNRNGHDANYLIIPSGCDQAVNARPEENYAIYNGVGVTNRDITHEGGMTVRTSRGFRVGEKQPNFDPHYAWVCLGGFFVMTNAAANLVPNELYKTNHRDVEVFSMSKDDYVRIEYANMFDYLGLYKDWAEPGNESPTISWIGHTFLAKYRTWGGLLDAAGEKQGVIDKINRFTDTEYDEFLDRFKEHLPNMSEFGANPLMYGDNAIAGPARFDLLDFTQPTIAAQFDASRRAVRAIKRASKIEWPIQIREVMQAIVTAARRRRNAPDAAFYLKFANNQIISCNRGTTDFARVPALYLYQCAGQHLVLFDIAHSVAPNHTVLAVTPSDSSVDITGVAQVYCARAQLSIAVSVLVGMLRWFNDEKSIAGAVPYIESEKLISVATAMQQWLKATRDYSQLVSDSTDPKLKALYSSTHEGMIDYRSIKQLPGQIEIPFDRLIACIITLSCDDVELPIADLKSIGNALLMTYAGGNGLQPSSGASFSPFNDNPYEAVIEAVHSDINDKTTAVSLFLAEPSNAEKVRDHKVRLGEFAIRIKAATEAALIQLAGGGRKSAGEQAILLDGFRSRFFALIGIVGQIYLVDQLSGKASSMIDPWYVNVLIVTSKLPNRTIAVRFLDDIRRAWFDKQCTSNGGATDVDFILPSSQRVASLALFTGEPEKTELKNAITKYLSKITSKNSSGVTYSQVDAEQVIVANKFDDEHGKEDKAAYKLLVAYNATHFTEIDVALWTQIKGAIREPLNSSGVKELKDEFADSIPVIVSEIGSIIFPPNPRDAIKGSTDKKILTMLVQQMTLLFLLRKNDQTPLASLVDVTKLFLIDTERGTEGAAQLFNALYVLAKHEPLAFAEDIGCKELNEADDSKYKAVQLNVNVAITDLWGEEVGFPTAAVATAAVVVPVATAVVASRPPPAVTQPTVVPLPFAFSSSSLFPPATASSSSRLPPVAPSTAAVTPPVAASRPASSSSASSSSRIAPVAPAAPPASSSSRIAPVAPAAPPVSSSSRAQTAAQTAAAQTAAATALRARAAAAATEESRVAAAEASRAAAAASLSRRRAPLLSTIDDDDDEEFEPHPRLPQFDVHVPSRDAYARPTPSIDVYAHPVPPQLTESQKRRLNNVALEKLLGSVPLTNGYWAKYAMRKNLPMPIGSIGFRLHKQYEMGTAVMMDKGGAVGYTYFGHADFQLGDDIGKKVHVAHFTLYLKSVVMFNRLIVYSRHVISRSYGGGEGTEAWHPLDDGDRKDYREGRMNKDIIFAPVLSNFRAQHIVMDVTGRFPASMTADQTANDGIHYESAELMRKVWGMMHSKTATIQVSVAKPLFQTIAMQEHTQTWNQNRQGYTDVTIDHTHWGPRVYPKCGKVRRGQSSYLERCHWEATKTLSIGV